MKKTKNKADLELIKKTISGLKNEINKLKAKIDKLNFKSSSDSTKTNYQNNLIDNNNSKGKIIYGVFDGQNMISDDNKKYSISANYASKSKLVEGDKLKLIILEDGTFIYKQIGPTQRKKIIGKFKVIKNKFFIEANNQKYQVMPASITYFKVKDNDQLVIIVPKNKKSKWAAIDNLIPEKQ